MLFRSWIILLTALTLIGSMVNDRELLAVFIRLIIGIVEKRGFRGLWTTKGIPNLRRCCQNRKDPFG
jgi:hypothetical protein